MKSNIFGPVLIDRPRRYPLTHPHSPGEVIDEDRIAPINPYKRGTRYTKKVKRDVYNPATGLTEVKEVEIPRDEPGIRFGPLGINLGTPQGREAQAKELSDTLTPELNEILEATSIPGKVGEAALLAPKLLKYAAAETVAHNVAQLAIPGFAPPVLAPIILGARAYRALYNKRIDFEFFVNSDPKNQTRRNRAILFAADTAMLPFDIAATVAGNAAAFGLNFLAGRTFLNKIPDQVAKLDPNLEGLKPIDDGLTNKILNVVDRASNLLTFGQPAVQPAKAA